MARYQGLIDLALLGAVPAGPLAVASDGAARSVAMPGVELRWNGNDVDIAQLDGTLALAAGGARLGTGASLNASSWIERYARHGSRAAEDVGGAFAVVIVDFRKRETTLLVDRFSIETLCYFRAGARLGFADAACDVPGSAKIADTQALYDYLYLHAIPAPQTLFPDVRRLEAGHCLVASATGSQTLRYWQPRFVEDDTRDLAGRLQRFVDIVRSSVEEEAGSAEAPACFLSGGTDSSTVAGMLTRLRGKPIHAYSIGLEAKGYDEMAYARIAARHFGLVHHEYYLTPDDVVTGIPKLAAVFDQPFGNSSALPAYFCALRAKEDGFGRMLAGDGGDELFGGNSRYAMQKVFAQYERLPAALRTRLLEPVAMRSSLFRKLPGLRQIGGYVRHASVPMPDRLQTFNPLLRFGIGTVLEPRFRAAIDPNHPIAQQHETWTSIKADSLLNHMLAYDWKCTLADSDLPKVRAATQLAGVSVGYPLLGRELTDFALSLPPDWKLKGLRLRWFFKRALRDFLPAEILRKKKHGFGLPFGDWVLRHAPLRELVQDSLDGVARRGIVRPEFTGDLLATHLPEAPGYYGELVWILVMLEQWLRAHRDIIPSMPAVAAHSAAADAPQR